MPSDVSLSQEESLALRKKKLDRLRQGEIAYPNDFSITGSIDEVRNAAIAEEVSAAGRLVSRRTAGKACFANIEDGTASVQIYASERDSKEALEWLLNVDFGDIVVVCGKLFVTKKGEKSINVKSGRMVAKCLQNYTPKVAPTGEQERKRRYLAMAMRPEIAKRFRLRSKIIAELRSFFEREGYLEVETPMLHPVQGGAAAKPFETELEALGRTYFLRIAPELYLKRLLVGGYDKVYEINRSFRNEGMSDEHNPEFTMLEFYATYHRYGDLMLLTERLIAEISAKNWQGDGEGNLRYRWGGHDIDLTPPYRAMTMAEALLETNGWDEGNVGDIGFLRKQAARHEGSKAEKASEGDDIGALMMLLFEKTVEKKLIQPTFITDFPASVSPLARRHDGNQKTAERFEFFVGGKEIANGFSELNDPEEQARVFKQQAKLAAEGDDEAMRYDEEYIAALRYGMPPAAGEGIGVDRLVMLLLECESIRDVIAFPHLRPEMATGKNA